MSTSRDQCIGPPAGGFSRYCVTSNQLCPASQSRTCINRIGSSGSGKVHSVSAEIAFRIIIPPTTTQIASTSHC